jgi:glycosyltransferase involved in cell wall biosynthesis
MPSSPSHRPMTVLQVVPALDTGGVERTTIDIAAALVRGGDRALVASEGGRLEAELAAVGGELIRLPAGTKNPAVMAVNALRLARLIRRERIDLVHARSRAPAWSALLACRATGAPFLTTYHGIYAERGAVKRFYNSVMARGEMVIANSHYTAGLIADRHGTPAERIAVIHRGTDLANYRPEAVDAARRDTLRRAWNLTGGEKVVLNVARLTGWKGQSLLIEAASLPPLAAQMDVTIVLAGDAQGRASYHAELESLVWARHLAGRVRIVGHCPDVPAALALADVAVIASTEPEAFGRFAVEAEAMGVPVVATVLGAATETVLAPPHASETDRTGWLAPPNDAAALAAAIGVALALLPEERAELSRRARAHAEHFSLEAMQEATLALYRKMLSPSRNGRNP